MVSFSSLQGISEKLVPKPCKVTLHLQKQRRENTADYVPTLALMRVILSRWRLFSVLKTQTKWFAASLGSRAGEMKGVGAATGRAGGALG